MGKETEYFVIKPGDVLKFLAISFHVGWDFDHPTFLLSPYFNYSPNGEACESFLEEEIIKITSTPLIKNQVQCDAATKDAIESDLNWCGTSLNAIKRCVRNMKNGKNGWKTRNAFIVEQEYRFDIDKENVKDGPDDYDFLSATLISEVEL